MLRFRRLLLVAVLLTGGCASEAVINPSFPATIGRARSVLSYDTVHPKPLQRPLVIVGGFLDPGFGPAALVAEYKKWTGDDRVIGVPLFWSGSFDQSRDEIVEAVQMKFPSADPTQTMPVDVVGISMGGLASIYAAQDRGGAGRRLNIARIFTISSPLRGALLATDIPLDLHPLQGDMRAGSAFLTRLYQNGLSPSSPYQVFSYTRLNDLYVGTYNAALPGQTPWWVQPAPFDPPHSGCYHDARILADIACRLRGDPTLAHEPPAPLPTDQNATTSTK